MTAIALLADLRKRGASIAAVGDRLRIEAPKGSVTQPLWQSLVAHKAELLSLLAHNTPPAFDPDTAEIAAVKLRNTSIGDVWLVSDAEALAEHPDIIRSGLPVFYFSEVDQLRGKSFEELWAIGMVKAVCPTGRVLQ